MIELGLGDQVYSWQGDHSFLNEKYFQINVNGKLNLLELRGTSKIHGVVLVGKISIIVDSVIYTQSHGAIGETTEFVGSSLAILGMNINSIQQSLKEEIDPNHSESIKTEADQLITKLRDSLTNKVTNVQFEEDSDGSYVIFGKSDLFLVGSSNELVVVHKKKISVRNGETSLVQVDPKEGIIIANDDECIQIGSKGKGSDLSILGSLGINFASKILDSIIWD